MTAAKELSALGRGDHNGLDGGSADQFCDLFNVFGLTNEQNGVLVIAFLGVTNADFV